MQKLSLKAPPSLAPYLDGALMRIGYLLPDVVFERDGNSSAVAAYLPEDSALDRAPAVRKEFFYALYREKIYAETLEIRKQLTGC